MRILCLFRPHRWFYVGKVLVGEYELVDGPGHKFIFVESGQHACGLYQCKTCKILSTGAEHPPEVR